MVNFEIWVVNFRNNSHFICPRVQTVNAQKMSAKCLLARRHRLIGTTPPARLALTQLNLVAGKPQLSIQSRSFFFFFKKKKESWGLLTIW